MLLKLKSFSLLNECQIDCKSDSKRKKIKERLKELSLLMTNWRLISIEWKEKWSAVVVVFNNGIISSIYLNRDNCITDVYHDRYLQNKLLSEHIVNVVLRDNYILVSYTQSKLTLVSITHPIDKRNTTKHKLKNRNTIISAIDLESGTTRRVERNLLVNESGDLLIVWWKTGTNCVAPWSAPGRNLRDLANIFVYSFTKSKFELISLGCISGQIYQICFMRWNPSQVVLLQQSANAANVLNYCVLEISDSSESLQQIYSIRIPLMRRCVRAQFTSASDRVVLLLDDDTINVFNIEHNSLYSLHSSVTAYDFACNPLDAILTVADQFGRISIYDYNLNTIHINYEQLSSDRAVGLNRMKFLDHSKLCLYLSADKYSDITLITLPAVIDSKCLVSQYLSRGKCDEAIACLQSINWNCYSDSAYFCLNYIFNHLIRQPLNSEREAQLETVLATFLTPIVPMVDDIRKEYKLEIHYMAKRFFYHLVRYNCLDKAFLLGIDLKSGHLFGHLHRIARQRHNERLAMAALGKQQQYSQRDSPPLQPSVTAQPLDCEHNNNNQVISDNKDCLIQANNCKPFETSPNIIGLPSVDSGEYNKFRDSVHKAVKDSHQMPITSILKSSTSKSSSKTKATVVGAKPVTFRYINPSEAYNKDIVFSEPPLNHKPRDSSYAISWNHTKSIDDETNSTNFKNHSFARSESAANESPIKPKYERASYSSYSSHCSSSSSSSTSSSHSSPYSSTSASLSIPTPPSESCVPPKLPPKTYLSSSVSKAPERPPKNLLINMCNSLDIEESEAKYSRTEVETESSVASIISSNMKSSSKIECIHFGVV